MELYQENQAIPRDLLLQKVKNLDGLLCLLSEKIDDELLRAAAGLKVVSNYAVGYDNIDVSAATRYGVVVTNTPEVLTDATADLAWALLLGTARRLVESDREMRRAAFSGWSPMYMLGNDITGKTLGILGAGRIGTAVVERSTGWKMKILYYDRNHQPHLDHQFKADKVSLDELISQSDFISVHLPLSPETYHLIDGKKLRKMKSTAILINTARGPIIDEAALVMALREKQIAGAGLDVYENEPEMAAGLADLENVTLVPHIGSATIFTRNEMARIAAENILAVLKGDRAPFTVNPEAYDNSD
jgi:lactate dehydrogenase-like 2-hydroxyacid dehydrogenase